MNASLIMLYGPIALKLIIVYLVTRLMITRAVAIIRIASHHRASVRQTIHYRDQIINTQRTITTLLVVSTLLTFVVLTRLFFGSHTPLEVANTLISITFYLGMTIALCIDTNILYSHYQKIFQPIDVHGALLDEALLIDRYTKNIIYTINGLMYCTMFVLYIKDFW